MMSSLNSHWRNAEARSETRLMTKALSVTGNQRTSGSSGRAVDGRAAAVAVSRSAGAARRTSG